MISLRNWKNPKKRSQQYVDELRVKKHLKGKKKDKSLTDFEAGLRAGYLQRQSDGAGMYKYSEALKNGKSNSEALAISKTKGGIK